MRAPKEEKAFRPGRAAKTCSACGHGEGKKRKRKIDPYLPDGLWASDEPLAVADASPKKGISGERYERYKKATTAREYALLGGSQSDLRFDIPRSHVRLLGAYAALSAPSVPTAPPPPGALVAALLAPTAPSPGAPVPRPVACGICHEPIRDAAAGLRCCKARVCGGCAAEVAVIVACPFCGGDPSPDTANDAAKLMEGGSRAG